MEVMWWSTNSDENLVRFGRVWKLYDMARRMRNSHLRVPILDVGHRVVLPDDASCTDESFVTPRIDNSGS